MCMQAYLFLFQSCLLLDLIGLLLLPGFALAHTLFNLGSSLCCFLLLLSGQLMAANNLHTVPSLGLYVVLQCVTSLNATGALTSM